MTESARAHVRAPQNFKALVAERVRQDIFQGRLKPGQKIDQDGLAEQLGISKLPVREALSPPPKAALTETSVLVRTAV